MKLKNFLVACAFLCSTQIAFASRFTGDEFNQERMRISQDTIYVISSFDNEDHISAYTLDGRYLWDAEFHSQIISWELRNQALYIFSKDRSIGTTYLTCLDIHRGRPLWQVP